ncbi:MAG TPA: AfsR/SARP family transcriptional regulator [Micromonosporaceae bacterium]|nr:AfsR/SARP family transcriptional regulator [Micromonosporaceae bacterium]
MAARLNDISILPSAAKPCQILAMLVLNDERLVTKSAVFEELWAEKPPSSATTTMHTYIHQLRRCIDRALGTGSALRSRDILVTERTGYSLRLYGGETDVCEFRRHVRQGLTAFENGDFQAASTLLARGLSMWRGPVLSDVPLGPLLSLEAMSLEDARMAALNRRIEADLHLGRHMEIMGELRALATQHPLNETFAAHYMVSLYHSGRVGKALEEFQRIRTTLVRELGIEPAARLRRLQKVILTGGPALEHPTMVASF